MIPFVEGLHTLITPVAEEGSLLGLRKEEGWLAAPVGCEWVLRGQQPEASREGKPSPADLAEPLHPRPRGQLV